MTQAMQILGMPSIATECGADIGGSFDWDKYRNVMYLVSGNGWQREYRMDNMTIRYRHKDVHGIHTYEEAMVIQQSLDSLKEE